MGLGWKERFLASATGAAPRQTLSPLTESARYVCFPLSLSLSLSTGCEVCELLMSAMYLCLRVVMAGQVCRDVIMVCDDCRQQQRGFYYCIDHLFLQNIYFFFLTSFSKAELEQQSVRSPGYPPAPCTTPCSYHRRL